MTSVAQGQVLPRHLLLVLVVLVEQIYGNKIYNIHNKPILRRDVTSTCSARPKTQQDDVRYGAELDMERQSARCVVWCGGIHAARRTTSVEQDHLPA